MLHHRFIAYIHIFDFGATLLTETLLTVSVYFHSLIFFFAFDIAPYVLSPCVFLDSFD